MQGFDFEWYRARAAGLAVLLLMLLPIVAAAIGGLGAAGANLDGGAVGISFFCGLCSLTAAVAVIARFAMAPFLTGGLTFLMIVVGQGLGGDAFGGILPMVVLVGGAATLLTLLRRDLFVVPWESDPEYVRSKFIDGAQHILRDEPDAGKRAVIGLGVGAAAFVVLFLPLGKGGVITTFGVILLVSLLSGATGLLLTSVELKAE